MTAPRNETTRRTEGVRTHGRSAKVVAKVLNATAVELGRSGYAALRIEEVAERCGVNKTTIYRRWPTKAELVQAALRSLAQPQTGADTGSLRSDLLAHFEPLCAKMRSTVGRGVVRTLQTEHMHPELEPLVRQLRAEQAAARCQLFERAIARGELPQGVNVELLAELAAAPVGARIMRRGAELDPAFIAAAIEVVIAGAHATLAAHGKRRENTVRS